MFALLKKTGLEFNNDRCMQLSAALSYYTLFSLAPLLVIGMMVIGLMFDPEDVRGHVRQEIQSLVGRDGAEQVSTMIEASEVSGRGTIATAISIVLLVVGATGLVGQLQAAINVAWGVTPDPEQNGFRHFLLKRILSFGMVLGTAFLMLVSLLLSAAVAAFGGWISQQLPGEASTTLLQLINTVITLGLSFLLFAAMFRFLPDAKVAWRDVGIGAAVTACLFVIGKNAMGIYLGSKNMESSFGAAGSLALLLTWIYYTSMIFLFGAEFTQVWASQRGNGIEPEPGAILVKPVQHSAQNSAPSGT